MQLFIDEIIRGLLAKSSETATIDDSDWHDVGTSDGSDEDGFIDWLTFKDLAESVSVDVKRIRNHPSVPSSIPIYGYIYDVKTGKLIEVPEAAKIGKAEA